MGEQRVIEVWGTFSWLSDGPEVFISISRPTVDFEWQVVRRIKIPVPEELEGQYVEAETVEDG